MPSTHKVKPDLAYIALSSRDITTTTAFLGEVLQLPAFSCAMPGHESVPAFRVGATAIVVLPQNHPFLTNSDVGVDHLALAATDFVDIDNSAFPSQTRTVSSGLNGHLQTVLDRSYTCGVCVRSTNTVPLPDGRSPIVERIDHIGIASTDNAVAESVFCDQLGAVYESRQTDLEVSTAIESFTSDKYGAIYHSRQPAVVGGLRVSFLSVGDLDLEFLQDFDKAHQFQLTHGASGTTKQDQSAIGRFIQNRGEGLHHIAFKVHDIDAVLSRIAAHGHRVIDQIGRPGSRRARIGFIHPSSIGGILFHLVQRTEITTTQ